MVDLMPCCPVGQVVTTGAKSPVSRLPCSEVATANIPKSMHWECYGPRLKGMSYMDSLSSPCMFPGIIQDCKLSSLDSLRRCDSAAGHRTGTIGCNHIRDYPNRKQECSLKFFCTQKSLIALMFIQYQL